MALSWVEVVRVAGEQRSAVEARLRRRDLAPRDRERLAMVKAVALGQGITLIASWPACGGTSGMIDLCNRLTATGCTEISFTVAQPFRLDKLTWPGVRITAERHSVMLLRRRHGAGWLAPTRQYRQRPAARAQLLAARMQPARVVSHALADS